MKKGLALVAFLILSMSSIGQTNEWTWMHGGSSVNSPGSFGVKGVSSPTNFPPATYEPCNWTDLNGNFWIFSGNGYNTNMFFHPPNLWKFDPTTNEWTWVHGPGLGGTVNPSVLGMGIADTSNHPGSVTFGASTWVDDSNNLWLFGGRGYSVNGGLGRLNDLWMYNIASNSWTWVKGSGNAEDTGISGIIGVPDPANIPRSRCETTVSWKDCIGDLWLMGGQSQSGSMSDVWRYSIPQNEWTRMEGNTSGSPMMPNYGTPGVESPTNSPGTRSPFGAWSDSCNNVYFFGGNYIFDSFGDTWKYDTDTENWTWQGGNTTTNSWGNYGDLGVASCSNTPPSRHENKSAWTDKWGNFWMFGGHFIGSGANLAYRAFNDLWRFNPKVKIWTWMDGDSTLNPGTFSYGTLGVSDPSNQPKGREGAASFTDLDGNLWMFGGNYRTGPQHSTLF